MKTWKKTISLVTAAAFVIGTAYFPVGLEKVSAAEKESISGDYVEGQVIVGYIDTDDMDLNAKQEEKSDELLGDSEELMVREEVPVEEIDVDESKLSDSAAEEEVVDETLALVESDSKSTEELIDEINQLPNVAYVEPNYIFKLAETTSTGNYTGKQWAYQKNNAYGVNIPDWNNSEKKNAEGTVVAVVDSGVDYKHEDLNDVMWDEGETIKALTDLNGGKYGIDVSGGDSDPMAEESSHGTHCAGIIAAEWNDFGVSGAANGTKIMAVKATYRKKSVPNDTTDYLNLSHVITSFNYVIAAKDAGVNVVAINASWGGICGDDCAPDLNTIAGLVNEAGTKGIVTVFASCNNGCDCDGKQYEGGKYIGRFITDYVKDSPYKLVVNSSSSGGDIAPTSNFGPNTTDVFAPGEEILSAEKTGTGSSTFNKNYGYKSGTSMAAPVVSAAVAILASHEEGIPAEKITDVIKQSVKKVSVFSKKCKSGGIVNVANAIEMCNVENCAKLTQNNVVYNGTEQKPTVNCGDLEEGIDYDVQGLDQNFTEPGKYIVTVKGKGLFFGTANLEYTVSKATPKVSLSSTRFIYNGVGKSVTVKVADAEGNVFTRDEDYTISGSISGKLPGTYRVNVNMTNGLEKYYNNTSATFRITVQPTSISGLSKGKKSFKVKVAKKTKSLVNGYQVRYSLKRNMSGAKSKTIGTKYNKISAKVSKLKKKTTYYVQVRAYKTIGNKKYYSDWSSIRTIKTK